MSTRAGIIVTGTEVLTGRVADRNGPWLAEQLRVSGVDVSEVIVVGDRASDLRDCLTFLAGSGVDVIITSGGLGPTADDLTAQIVAEFQGRPPELDLDLEARIATIIERLSAGRGWRLDPQATAAAVRKQALVPLGANVLAPVGTAPGLVVPVADGRTGPPVIVLPGPPAELQPMWPAALADPVVSAALGAREELFQRTIRLWGTPESELAALLRTHDQRLADLEITTCLRGGELEIVTRFGPAARSTYDEFDDLVADTFADTVFSRDGRTVDQVVADALRVQNRTIATAESCTAGLLAGRLTDLAGSSDYVRGGLIVYSDAAKHELAGVPTELIATVGAVSAEVAAALAAGARDRLVADIGVGITGVAGPGGGTALKPVGLVHLCVTGPDRTVARTVNLPGGRTDVRARTVTVAMHLLRGLLLR
ncbi:MAG: competence/damage-inducible protein A [Jatrophihabitans sp.]